MGRSCQRPVLCRFVRSMESQKICYLPGFTQVLYEDYKFYWIILKLLGLLPYHIDKNGNFRFNFMSKEMVYSLIVYAVTSVPVAMTFNIRFQQQIDYSGNFDVEMCLYMFSLFLVPHVMIPFSHWGGMARIVATFKKWHAFESNYEIVMKHKLSLRWGWSAHLYLMPGIPGLLIFLVLCIRYIGKATNISIELVAHSYVLVIVLIHLIVLLGVGYRLIQIAREIRFQLMEAIQMNDLDQVRQITGLWTRYGEVCNSLGAMFYRMYSYILLMIFALSTITAYAFIKAIARNQFSIGILYQTSCLINNNVWLYFMCECGHRITAEAGGKFIRLIGTSRGSVKDQSMRNELDSFLAQISSYPVALSLNGFVVLNRPLLVSIKATMSTYLIVVLQFSQEYSPLTLPPGNVTNLPNKTFLEK